jgi:hypothetical protein
VLAKRSPNLIFSASRSLWRAKKIRHSLHQDWAWRCNLRYQGKCVHFGVYCGLSKLTTVFHSRDFRNTVSISLFLERYFLRLVLRTKGWWHSPSVPVPACCCAVRVPHSAPPSSFPLSRSRSTSSSSSSTTVFFSSIVLDFSLSSAGALSTSLLTLFLIHLQSRLMLKVVAQPSSHIPSHPTTTALHSALPHSLPSPVAIRLSLLCFLILYCRLLHHVVPPTAKQPPADQFVPLSSATHHSPSTSPSD